MRKTVAEGSKLLRQGGYTVHFRPEKDLPEDQQYCLVYDHRDFNEGGQKNA
jgi:hypothetical protein